MPVCGLARFAAAPCAAASFRVDRVVNELCGVERARMNVVHEVHQLRDFTYWQRRRWNRWSRAAQVERHLVGARHGARVQSRRGQARGSRRL